MFRLAHISDIHLSPLPQVRLRELASKRITGYINWKRHRKDALHDWVLNNLITDLKARAPDHIAVTGDLVNLALNLEIDNGYNWLKQLGSSQDVSFVPGNHDAYVPGALEKSCCSWEPWMRGDGIDNHNKRPQFPYLRERDGVAIIGVSSARATGPFMASGDFLPAQAARLKKMLTETGEKGLCRVVLIHHPPVRNATPAYKRLFGIGRFQKIIREAGAELVLHGHTHLATYNEIASPHGAVPVICVPSASQAPYPVGHEGRKPPARYNLFSIAPAEQPLSWQCLWQQYGFTSENTEVQLISEQVLMLGRSAPQISGSSDPAALAE
ncbi:metallophosphoesterase [Pseudochrobactrum sp. sp1633]|uniref:metallophosphoesterase family protein n=1 Tax=Pseudochrobactrum sp. sp1633 TaxID=3036706 RepID=UPI0025A62954|nr:metallophosphoesterase [Pseudochrobactrum sp. sp1633]MDM8343877.1 metallophosphoesterase [Pseudochrobactrum sp. sp1633]HWD11731.1 metallophosphoesterase [Pseudochrobactrum sp.]